MDREDREMKGLWQFLKTTIVGGLVFLVPVVALVVVIGKALQLSRKVAEPMAAFLPLDSIAWVAIANVIGGIVIVVLCFLAGLAARTSLASTFVRESETRFLWKIPGYSFVKGFTDSLSGEGANASMLPVLMKLDDASQLVFEIERLADGRVVAFVPGAPDPWSGAVMVVDADRVEPLAITMMAAVQNIRMLGRDTRRFLGTHPDVVKAG
jgi:uncharacterized membrane protein